ncbi:MAG: NAD(P)/FAD-dependent oxidoreductase [Candidatus Marinimicrobia bacterium]|nr:NAD(P)/FAD-dependent oxidoreductase [Candidatus Neomarinimicrobiota bacterium]MBL7010311.1 NAD(P)/FAD-dependent oxidoreductase [Candidatus Neomarinimicrobiota bacterium]MBL7030566.1 NAD(P)/FAD-dependent oxidoreductase [Candidatus Neomarinimicrobiota bacterium]
MSRFDIIVVGGGLNSLVTASMLGKAGKKVLVLEARDQIGGLASTSEFAPGFKCNDINDVVKWIDPRVMKQLNLESYGLELHSPDLVRIALDTQGQHIVFHRDPNETADSIANHSEKDAKAWKAFTEYIDNLTYFLEKLYELTPPKLPNIGLKEAFSMRAMLSPIRRHGTRGLVDFMRVAPMMMPELMDEWFENELLRAGVSTAGIHHLSFGPFAAATGLNLLHQHVHSKGVFHNVHFIKGGTSELPNAVKLAAESVNVEIRTNSKVSAIHVENGVCSGVTLESGETFQADQVVSGLDPQNTFIKLVGPPKLNPTFATQLRNINYRGSTARIHFALNALPEIKGVTEDQMGTIFSASPSIEYLERTSDSVKYGRLSENPFVEFSIPSILNPTFAPNGKHVLSATIQYAPYHLRGMNWSEELKNKLKNNVVNVLGNYIPEISSLIESSLVLSPVDLERQFGLTEGNLNHGEMTLDQFLFMRPTISTAQYKSPIENLYLCGPGTHPGGGLHGANGFNAAREILK